MPQPLTRLLDLAQAALAAVVDRWPVEAEPLPARRYVSNGMIVWDCDEVVVMAGNTFGAEADPGSESFLTQASAGYAIRAAIIEVLILRCAPDPDDEGNPPTAATIEANATVILTDAMAAFNCLVEAQEDGDLATCQGLAFERWTSEGPLGGLAGGTTRFRALLL